MVGGVLEIHVRICVKMPLNRNRRSISSFSLLLYSLLVLEYVLLFFDKNHFNMQCKSPLSPRIWQWCFVAIYNSIRSAFNHGYAEDINHFSLLCTVDA